MFSIQIVLLIFIIFIGVKLSKINFDRGVSRISHFRMRYTIIIILVLGMTNYVERLPPAEKEKAIKKVNAHVEAVKRDVQKLIIDKFDAALSAVNDNK